MGALVTLAVAWPRLVLVGYLTGALLHLLLDVLLNGEQLLLRPVLFYSIAYTARLGFSRHHLVARLALSSQVGEHPAREFFSWRPTERRLEPIPAALESLQAGSWPAGASKSTNKNVAHKSKAVTQGRVVQVIPILGTGDDDQHHA